MVVNDMHRKSEAGFTMVEVSMSLVFIAFIILFLTASLMSLFGTYNKGVWLSKVDQAVRQMRLDISDSVRFSGHTVVLSKDGKAYRLCGNGISYLWNTDAQLRRHKKDDGDYGKMLNHFDGNHNIPLKMVRILDLTGSYCKSIIDSSKSVKDVEFSDLKQPKIENPNVQTLLSTGVALQSMQVVQGERNEEDEHGKKIPELKRNVPVLYVSGAISTEGINAPTLVKYDKHAAKWTVLHDDEDSSKKLSGSSWQCGDWIDVNHNGIRDESDIFKPNKGQFCANTQFDITVYERGVVR